MIYKMSTPLTPNLSMITHRFDRDNRRGYLREREKDEGWKGCHALKTSKKEGFVQLKHVEETVPIPTGRGVRRVGSGHSYCPTCICDPHRPLHPLPRTLPPFPTVLTRVWPPGYGNVLHPVPTTLPSSQSSQPSESGSEKEAVHLVLGGLSLTDDGRLILTLAEGATVGRPGEDTGVGGVHTDFVLPDPRPRTRTPTRPSSRPPP